MTKRHPWLRLLLLCPLVIGTAGLLADHRAVADALYMSMQMYVLNFSGTPANLLVELARWTAPLATAGSILLVISILNQKAAARIRTLLTDTVAVYGPEEDAARLLSQLGARGIRGTDRLLPARNYILLGKQEDSFAFYEANRRALEKVPVYLRCDTLPAQSVSPMNLHLFQPMEIEARLFWKAGGLLEAADEKDGQLNIVFVGFGRPGEELLHWGLQYNVFSPRQRICYHIFADASDFLAAHPMLDQIGDPVLAYDDRWQAHLPVLVNADLILVTPCGLERALETTVYQLLSLVPEKQITVFADSGTVLSMLDEQERLRIIDVPAQALQVGNIMESDLLRSAMRVNLRYAHLYGGVAETEENARAEWAKLSAFLRYSNISSADYHEIRRLMIRRMGGSPDGSRLTGEQRELLAELEHMRWCRYHWLNNWRCGVPEDGKAKDAARHIHADLIPYRELTEAEKEKDRTTIGVMLGLQ